MALPVRGGRTDGSNKCFPSVNINDDGRSVRILRIADQDSRGWLSRISMHVPPSPLLYDDLRQPFSADAFR